MGVPLLDKNTGSVVDVNPDQVPAALKSGAFSFIKGRNVPVVMNGKETYVSPENAGRYIDDLRFANEADVERGIAERRTAGIGGAVEATALGLGKALTLGAGPALLGAVSDTARERMRELELGRPGITTAAEIGGLLVDPFALAGRVGQRAALRGAEQLAAREAEQAAARAAVSPEIGAGQAAALFGPARQTPAGVAAQVAGEVAQVGRGAIGREVSPLALGRQAAAPTAEEAARLTAEFEARQAAIRQGAIDRARAVATDEAGQVVEEASLRMRPLTGPTSPAEPGLRLGADPFRTEGLAMRGRQAEELMARGQAARTAEGRIAEEAAGMERGLQPGQVGPMEDFTRAPSEFLQAGDARNQMANLEEALQANAAAASRARSEAGRQRLAAERDRLLAQRDELEYTLFGAETRAEEAMATQAERALGAAEMQAGAPARALEAERMGRMAGEIEAANVLPPTLRTAETRVAAENVSPRLGIPAAAEPNVSPLGLGMAETGVMPAGRGLALGAPIEARAAQAATDVTAAAAPGLVERIGRPALEGALYSGATQAYKQELGLEPGGVGEVLAAAALGGVIGKGLALGGKALVKGQKALTDVAAESAPGSLAAMIGKGAAGIEQTHLLRQWGQSQKAVRKLNERFTEDELGKLGSSAMTDYIRNAAARVEELKAAHPENQFIQSINIGKSGLTFTNLSSEQRNAMAQVLRDEAGQAVERVYGPALEQAIGSDAILAAIARAERKVSRPGLGDIPLRSIREEAESLRKAIQEGERFTVRKLRDFEIGASREFERKQGLHEPFTEAQSALRNEVKNVYLDAAEQSVPGLRQALVQPNREYTLADMLAKGSKEVLAKNELTSPVGRDSLAQFALGAFAMVQPVAAAAFFLGTTALRGLYNQRGEGFIADMAGKLSRKATSVAAAPEAAAREVTQSIINARRPMLGALNGEKLVEVKPTDYTSLSQGIRELAASTDYAHEKIRQATASMPPDQQERYIADYDATMQKLVDEMPKGIPTDKALSEAERRWTVMARSLFDHSYATQTIANGGPMATAAAQGLTMIPNGQKYLDELSSNLQRAIAENTKLRGNQELATVARNFSKVRTGGGGIRIQRTIHGGSQAFQPPAGGRLPTPGASGQAAARNAFGGAAAGQR